MGELWEEVGVGERFLVDIILQQNAQNTDQITSLTRILTRTKAELLNGEIRVVE